MVESILRDYGGRMARAIKRLQRLKPDIQIDHLRCICSLYDLVVQQGSLDKAWDAIEERVTRENPQDQFALTHIAVEERGRKALQQWQADAVSRRVGHPEGRSRDRRRSPARQHQLLHAARRARRRRGGVVDGRPDGALRQREPGRRDRSHVAGVVSRRDASRLKRTVALNRAPDDSTAARVGGGAP